jgi:hypothetical protein
LDDPAHGHLVWCRDCVARSFPCLEVAPRAGVASTGPTVATAAGAGSEGSVESDGGNTRVSFMPADMARTITPARVTAARVPIRTRSRSVNYGGEGRPPSGPA